MIVECNLSQDELIKNNIGIQDTSDAKFGEKWALITIYDKIITTDIEDKTLYIYVQDIDEEDIVLKIENIDNYDLLWKCIANTYIIYIARRTVDIDKFMMNRISDSYYANTGEHIYFKPEPDTGKYGTCVCNSKDKED